MLLTETRLLLLSFATHGFTRNGVPHLLARELDPEASEHNDRQRESEVVWRLLADQAERLEIVDQNRDGRRDISVWMDTSHVFYIDFTWRMIAHQRSDGSIGDAQVGLITTR